jgi:hypothetical protein
MSRTARGDTAGNIAARSAMCASPSLRIILWPIGCSEERKSRSALDQRTLRLELVQSYRSAKRQEKWEATPMLDLERRVIGKVMRRLIPFLILCYFVAYLDRVSFI